MTGTGSDDTGIMFSCTGTGSDDTGIMFSCIMVLMEMHKSGSVWALIQTQFRGSQWLDFKNKHRSVKCQCQFLGNLGQFCAIYANFWAI